MPKFTVRAQTVISMTLVVEAATEEAALHLANRRHADFKNIGSDFSILEAIEAEKPRVEHTVKFTHKGKEHEYTFLPTDADEWMGFRSKGLSFDLHYCEDYNHIVVYEYLNGKCLTDITLHNQPIQEGVANEN